MNTSSRERAKCRPVTTSHKEFRTRTLSVTDASHIPLFFAIAAPVPRGAHIWRAADKLWIQTPTIGYLLGRASVSGSADTLRPCGRNPCHAFVTDSRIGFCSNHCVTGIREPDMLTGMTERDWSTVLEVFDAAQSSRGEPGYDDRKL